MHMTRRLNKVIPGVFLLLVSMVVCLGVDGLANAPVLDDLRISSIVSSSLNNAWVVGLTMDVSHDPINEVLSVVVTAYNSAAGDWDSHIVSVSIASPFQSFEGGTAYAYAVTLEIPKADSGRITIEARAAHSDEWGGTLWEGWIPQEPTYVFSGGLAFTDGTEPAAVGTFESTHWILSVSACEKAVITLYTLNCRLLCSALDAEIPSWWRVWDSSSDNDGEHDSGELVDTGWIAAAEFIAQRNLYKIYIPTGWSGKITFQLRMERSGFGHHAGSYSAALKVDVHDEI